MILPFVIETDRSEGCCAFAEGYFWLELAVLIDLVVVSIADSQLDGMVEADRIIGEEAIGAELDAAVLALQTRLTGGVAEELTRVEIVCSEEEILQSAR